MQNSETEATMNPFKYGSTVSGEYFCRRPELARTLAEYVKSGQNVVMQDIFTFRQSGVDEHGRVIGYFRPTGAVPTFFEHLKSRGLRLDPAMFDPTLDREVHLEIAGGNA